MSEAETEQADHEARPSTDMSEGDKRSVSNRSPDSAKVVHEVVRLQGDEELQASSDRHGVQAWTTAASRSAFASVV